MQNGASTEACLVAAFDSVAGDLRTRMLAAHRDAGCWVDGVRAALLGALAFFDEDPARARFLVVASLTGGPLMRLRRERLLAELAEELDAKRPTSHEADADEHSHAQAVTGAVAAVIHARLLEEPVPQLTPLGGILMSVIVMPYLGSVAARGELERAAA